MGSRYHRTTHRHYGHSISWDSTMIISIGYLINDPHKYPLEKNYEAFLFLIELYWASHATSFFSTFTWYFLKIADRFCEVIP